MMSAAGSPASFLGCSTPQAWIDAALDNLDILLIDHANCEKKAAATAISMMFRYEGHGSLVMAMSRIAREELRHHEQVLRVLARREVEWRHLGPARYAAGLRTSVRANDPDRLVDLLVCGAFVEARSWERFAVLVPALQSAGEPDLADFYQRLLESEARHWRIYLDLANDVAGEAATEQRTTVMRSIEAELVRETDEAFRFHSGTP